RALLSNGSNFTATTWSVVGSADENPLYVPKLILLDVNGDGKTDIASIAYNAQTEVYKFNGQKFVTDNLTSYVGSVSFLDSSETQYYISGDFNGDGNMDLAHVYSQTGDSHHPTQLIVCLSDGKSKFYAQQDTGSPYDIAQNWSEANQVIPGDFD